VATGSVELKWVLRLKPGWPGVDVMITIFCDFWQFLAEKWSFSQKPMLWSNFWII
jgi:hypothetical protein